ncbi:MAG: 3-keto-5-aminohexanoate cleavage protein [Solirubrobacterales bacterium]|nr:3-keto-5-aminohexanoate cleavage protein [Solirubrobacterales bacterium]
MDKLIISVAVNGGQLQRTDTPHVPITPPEIADSIIASAQAGAAIAHFHIRGDDGAPSADPERYREVRDLVRLESDVALNFSTDLRLGGGRDCLRLGPEIASLPAGSVNLGDGVIAAPRPLLFEVANEMARAGVRGELEIFHEGMLGTARRLAESGLIHEPVFCQFCLGFDGGAPADAAMLLRLIAGIPAAWKWSLAVEGDGGLPLLALATGLGGHVRVGIEDTIMFSAGQLAVSNAQFVERSVRLATELGRPVATAAQARAILALPTAHQHACLPQ